MERETEIARTIYRKRDCKDDVYMMMMSIMKTTAIIGPNVVSGELSLPFEEYAEEVVSLR